MDELENELAKIVGTHGIVKVLAALTQICWTIADPNLAPSTRDKADHFPYHGWRQLGHKLKVATRHACDLRMN